ncbi:MAG: 30S ribosomal protein S9 [Alphaproteobacteria bacterium]|nr:30S ribosomal protein S9 [Alphaproteobacteria bacterium]
MAETVKDLKDLKEATTDAAEAAAPAAEETSAPKEPKIDDLGRSYATGRRKESVARVWLTKGSGKVIVNGKAQEQYFGRQTHLLVLNQPFLVADRVNQFDVMCTVKGGGLSGQAGAVRHGISRALENFEPALRPALKKAGMLTRDARVVERKKIGKHKARRTKQWAKR